VDGTPVYLRYRRYSYCTVQYIRYDEYLGRILSRFGRFVPPRTSAAKALADAPKAHLPQHSTSTSALPLPCPPSVRRGRCLQLRLPRMSLLSGRRQLSGFQVVSREVSPPNIRLLLRYAHPPPGCRTLFFLPVLKQFRLNLVPPSRIRHQASDLMPDPRLALEGHVKPSRLRLGMRPSFLVRPS